MTRIQRSIIEVATGISTADELRAFSRGLSHPVEGAVPRPYTDADMRFIATRLTTLELAELRKAKTK